MTELRAGLTKVVRVCYMKLFEFQTRLTSFKYPIIKIIVCLSLIILAVLRNSIFQISNIWINAIVTLLSFLITMASILCLCISVCEVIQTIENRQNTKIAFPVETKQVSIETIINMISENDIIEFDVCKDEKIFKIGSSAVCDYAFGPLRDKLFYIASSEYETIELFTEALLKLFPERSIPVFEIDGLPPKAFRRVE